VDTTFVREGRVWRQATASTSANPCVSSTDATITPENTSDHSVSDLWKASWARLRTEHHDLDERWATIESCPSVARSMASAGREAGRVVRGAGSLAELKNRLGKWEASVLKALAAQDHARSERLCLDCAGTDAETETVLPGLTSGRVCRKCLREATP